jgi:endonuclease/exonuclease/phosphatase family metal-dependent hydrolase
LVTLHVNYGKQAGDRVPELKAIAEWLADWAEREFSWNHNLITLGDFNIDRAGDPLFEAFTSHRPDPGSSLGRTATHDLRQARRRALLRSNRLVHEGPENRPLLILGAAHGGRIDFVSRLRGTSSLTDLSWHISDHYPLWTEFAIPLP